MVHTIHILSTGAVHTLVHVDDVTAKAIMKWWLPDGEAEVVPEYFYQAIKEGDVLKRAVLLRRTAIAAIDVIPEVEKEPKPRGSLPAVP